jgi:hypothetical protein
MALVPTLFDFEGGTPIYSAQVDSNFAALRNAVNGGLDSSNLASSAVTAAKIATLPRVKAAVGDWNHLASQGGGILFSTAEYDTDNLYDDVNEYFTVITAGVYMVHVMLEQKNFAPGLGYIRRIPGGSGTPVNISRYGTLSVAEGQLSGSGMDYFSSGDRIDATWTNYHSAQSGISGGFIAATWLSP